MVSHLKSLWYNVCPHTLRGGEDNHCEHKELLLRASTGITGEERQMTDRKVSLLGGLGTLGPSYTRRNLCMVAWVPLLSLLNSHLCSHEDKDLSGELWKAGSDVTIEKEIRSSLVFPRHVPGPHIIGEYQLPPDSASPHPIKYEENPQMFCEDMVGLWSSPSEDVTFLSYLLQESQSTWPCSDWATDKWLHVCFFPTVNFLGYCCVMSSLVWADRVAAPWIGASEVVITHGWLSSKSIKWKIPKLNNS